MSTQLDLQVASSHPTLPDPADIQTWVDATLATQLTRPAMESMELTVRIVDTDESRALNHQYRGKDAPTNVLSFPFEAPPGVPVNLLGDLVICAQVVEQEAKQQNKAVMHHWAHMIVHGCLHLFGFDHIETHQAEEMEALEISILAQLAIDDPYQVI